MGDLNAIALTGLVLDAVGVIFLGWDLLRLQRQNKEHARERLLKFDDVAESYGGIRGWLSYIKNEAVWNQTDHDEDLTVRLHGTFDATSAERSFAELIQAVDGIREYVETMANIAIADAGIDEKSANVSLVFSYTGLVLVVTGFALQIVAQFISLP